MAWASRTHASARAEKALPAPVMTMAFGRIVQRLLQSLTMPGGLVAQAVDRRLARRDDGVAAGLMVAVMRVPLGRQNRTIVRF